MHKIIAGYHQFHAVNAAVEETVRASGMGKLGKGVHGVAGTYWARPMQGGTPGDRRAGVVWHTQGSGKSFSMLFYAARVIRHVAMQSPTLVVLTDRNDLDDQRFGHFQRCIDLLGETPVQATTAAHPTLPSTPAPDCSARPRTEAPVFLRFGARLQRLARRVTQSRFAFRLSTR